MKRPTLVKTGQLTTVVAMCLGLLTDAVQADPCGMVPPIYVGNDVPIARVGEQKTYVFFKDGVETVVIRPGFEGKVDEFGMLIPFPAIPDLRKVSDNIFPHIAAAIDPPEVVINVGIQLQLARGAALANFANNKSATNGLALQRDEVRVAKEEAVGMYEVAVLEAGSAAALKKWIDEHGYQYPEGMDNACNDYVKQGWCFVAVKTKVGQKKGVDPKPGMRKVDSKLPDGSTFDGNVQAMGFRFKVRDLVVPMRLSTFNEGDLQVFHKQNLKQRRDPSQHNGAAKDLFAADLLSVKEDRLTHPHEEVEKMLLAVGERLNLRGPEIDQLNEASLKAEREEIVKQGLEDLKGMTLTVVDGSFQREVLASRNLTFSRYTMPSRRNKREFYDAKTFKPADAQAGAVHYGEVSFNDVRNGKPSKIASLNNDENSTKTSRLTPAARRSVWSMFAVCSCLIVGAVIGVRRRGESRR